MRILITGERGVGKSTLVEQIFKKLMIKPSGFRTIPLYKNSRKMGYFIQDLQTSEKRLFAHRDFTSRRRFGGFGIHQKAFDEFGTQILERAVSERSWILIDEVGVMEVGSLPFVEALKNLWKSPLNQFWVVQKRSPFPKTLAGLGLPYSIFEVTVSNRVELVRGILKEIRNGEASGSF